MMTRKLRLAARLVLGGALVPGLPAWGVELSGTAFTVIYRGPAQAPTDQAAPAGRPQMNLPNNIRPLFRIQTPTPQVQRGAGAGAGAILRLADARNGAEVARASYDPRLDGWMFQLPMNASPAGGGCMTLRSASGGMLALRDSSGADDGLSFFNPLWANELGRQIELAEIKRDLATLDARQAEAQAEQSRLQAAWPAAACEAPPVPPDPARPAAAIDPAEARAAAPGVCAARWHQVLSKYVDLGRMFQDAGLASDWASREAGAGAAQALPQLRLNASVDELNLVLDAARKGRAFLEHANGVQILQRVQAVCRAELPAQAAAATREWEALVQQARQTPARVLKECQAGKARLEQLKTQLGAGAPYRAELERRATSLASALPPTTSVSLDQSLCR
jgi:hypothetical protein